MATGGFAKLIYMYSVCIVGLRRKKYDTGLLSIIFIYRPVKSHRYGLVVPAQNRICQIQQAVAVLRGRRYVSAENRTVYTVYTAITCGLCLSSLFPEITPDSVESSDGLTEEPLGIAGTISVTEPTCLCAEVKLHSDFGCCARCFIKQFIHRPHLV